MHGKELICKMNDFLTEDLNVSAADDTALPFETLDDYSTDPIGFGEMSAMMLKKVEFAFDLAVKYNRRSSQYLKCCAKLERGIKYLGSCCLTKHALWIHDKNNTFPELGQLTTTKLYGMVSFHFRKLDRALSEYIREKNELDDALFDMQMRYFNLLRRLRSTEVKIDNFRDKYYYDDRKNYDPIIHGLAFSEKSWTKSIHEHEEPAAFRNAQAFPILAEIGENKKSEIRNKKSDVDDGIVSDCSGTDDCSASLNPGSRIPDPVDDGIVSDYSGADDCSASLNPGSCIPDPVKDNQTPDLHPEMPETLKIMQRVIERSAENKDGSLTFTADEMKFLVRDPIFADMEPDLAADMRRALKEMDSG